MWGRKARKIRDLQICIDGLCADMEVVMQKQLLLDLKVGALDVKQDQHERRFEQEKRRFDGQLQQTRKRLDRIQKIY